MRDLAFFALIRLALWGALWWILAQVGVGVYLAGVLAAAIAMLISILFLSGPRDRAARRWKAADDRRAERKAQRRSNAEEDAAHEDALVDRGEP